MTDFKSLDANSDRKIVYVREVKTSDLPEEIQEQASGRDHIYAIHADTGEVLALVGDRDKAFIVARQNSFSPVSVH